MDFKKFLESSIKELDREVERILTEQLGEAKKTDKKLIPLIQAFTKSCQGGKGIRGALVILGYQLGQNVIPARFAKASARRANAGIQKMDFDSELDPRLRGDDRDKKNDKKEIIKIAAAYEIFHSSVLAHDDIIDQSDIRRDRPSLYKALGGNQYGISQAISLANWGFFLAFGIISGSSFPDKNRTIALELFSKVMMDTAWGELLDLEETDRFVVMKLKTASYTISGPLQLGAVLAGGAQGLVRILGEFGENLGIAYQIKDDVLDGEVKGAVDVANRKAQDYKDKSINMLPLITKDQKLIKILEQMGEYLVERNK